MLIGRLVETRQNGLLSYSGLLGIGDGDSWLDVREALVQHQMDVYLNGGDFQKYASYDTEPAFFGSAYGLIDELTGFTPSQNLKLFHVLTSVLTAAAFSIFIVWVDLEFNIFAAVLTLFFVMTSEWLALFAGSIYWNLWAYYLPFLGVLFYFRRVSQNQKYSTQKIFLLVYITVLITGLVRGFLFETTTLIMLTVPLFYYAVKDAWGWTTFIKRMLTVSVSALAGTFTAFGVLVLQIAFVEGSLGSAWAHIQDSLLKRSFANPDQFSGVMAESLKANWLDVLQIYFQGRALNLNGVLHTKINGFEISYGSIILFFAVCTALFFIKEFLVERSFTKNKTALGLIFCTWASILAPLSWLVLFKAHSFIHTHTNFILWQMPFVLFGFCLCGFVLSTLIQRGPGRQRA